MRRLIPAAAALLGLTLAAPLRAQGLRAKISDLFIFGGGEDPLFLAGSADPNNPAFLQIHGTHFVPASSAQNASLIGFITDAVGANVANLPTGSTSGGDIFRFEGGVPVKTSTSAGPIFAERALTLGRGRGLVGVTRSGFRLASLRGVNLRQIDLNFTHQNVDFPGCSATFGDDCKKMGVPGFENDVIAVRLALDLDIRVTSFYVTYGLTDRIDVGAVVPVVSNSLRGSSRAEIEPFGGTSVAHYFSGTPTNPELTANRNVDGDATGLGDVSLRMKANVHESPRTSVALLADARFPTGSTADLMGAGGFTGRGLAIISSRYGAFSPHVNFGYAYRAGSQENDAVLGTVGFDDQIADRVTLAADLLSELQVGNSRLQLPEPVEYVAPFRRTVDPTTIPDMRDDIINGSFGFRFTPRRDLTATINALFPLNRGGLRADVTYTAGVELSL